MTVGSHPKPFSFPLSKVWCLVSNRAPEDFGNSKQGESAHNDRSVSLFITGRKDTCAE